MNSPVPIDTLPSDRLLRILDLTHKLAAPYDLRTMLGEVLQAGLEVLRADSGSIWLYDDAEGVIRMHLPEVEPAISVRAGEGLVGECLAKNQLINVPDCYADPRFNPEIDRKTGYRTRCILSIPLVGFDSGLVGVLQLLNKEHGPFDQVDEQVAMALASQSAVALQRAQLTDSLIAKERLDEEIALAREVQLSTLPRTMPAVPGYDFGSGFVPAEYTGGDLFDLVEHAGEVFMLMGDATGHGFGPALSATQMQAMFRVALRTGASLEEAYLHVNNQLSESLPDDKFLTAFLGFLDPVGHRLRYHAPGQGPLLHYRRSDDACDWYSPTSFPIGVMELDEVGAPREIELGEGDIFAVISDGVFEYENADGEQFGEQRVAQLVRGFRGASMADLRQKLLNAVYAFSCGAEQLDDITIVLVRRRAADDGRRLHLHCRRDVDELERIVAATHDFLEPRGFPDTAIGTVDFAIEEMFVNMVKYNTTTFREVDIVLELADDGVRVALTDTDVDEYDPTARPEVDVDAPLEQRTPGGLGVFLTGRMTEEFSYHWADRVGTISFRVPRGIAPEGTGGDGDVNDSDDEGGA